MPGKISEDERKTYLEVGKIVSQARDMAHDLVEPDQKLLKIADDIEDLIVENGAKPAFPCNISINEKAAHYTPPAEDETEVEEGDLVKVDIGAHIDGYIADTALTICAGEEENEMVTAIEEVLAKAVDSVEPGMSSGELGKIIEDSSEERGYKPISNLTGHNLEPWSLHGGISFPNVEREDGYELEEGDVIALEPFITDGEGEVEDMAEVYIFRHRGNKGVSGRMALQTLQKIKTNYGSLPFAERWLTKDFSRIRLQMTLRELIVTESIRPYYVLKEVGDGTVAQAEHTIIVTKDGRELTTS